MPSSSERIVSTSTGDVLGSRWGRPQPPPSAAAPPPPPSPAHRSTPPAPQHQPAERGINGGDIMGGRRTAAPPPEPIVSTIDEGDIIGHARRWVPTIDRPSSSSTPTTTSSPSTAAAAANNNNNNNNQLLHSRYAAASSRNHRGPAAAAAADPTTTSTSTSTSTSPSPSQQQLSKLKRLIDRLSWKSHTLLFTQHVALQSGEALSNNNNNTASYARPTTMFKLDFFEYYALLERILVLFLALFRVPLPSASLACKSANGNGNGNASGSSLLLPISGRGGGMWNHRYHESVLEALEGTARRREDDDGDGDGDGDGSRASLGAVLGSEEVVAVLRRAKGFRNRWKDADERVDVVPAWEWQREEVEGLRLGSLLEVVLGALERAYRVAEERVVGLEGCGGGGGGGGGVDAGGSGEGTWQEVGGLQNGCVDEDMEDAPWEAVGDAMEDVMDMDVE